MDITKSALTKYARRRLKQVVRVGGGAKTLGSLYRRKITQKQRGEYARTQGRRKRMRRG